jgi:hypothetical protein
MPHSSVHGMLGLGLLVGLQVMDRLWREVREIKLQRQVALPVLCRNKRIGVG